MSACITVVWCAVVYVTDIILQARIERQTEEPVNSQSSWKDAECNFGSLTGASYSINNKLPNKQINTKEGYNKRNLSKQRREDSQSRPQHMSCDSLTQPSPAS